MSTISEIGRMPAWIRRVVIHSGLAAVGSTPRTVTAVKRSHPRSSSTCTGYPPAVADTGVIAAAGSVYGRSSECASSRATPRAEKQ